MKTTTLSPSKRKIINLDETTFKTLSIMAIEEGTNLKNYIEKLLADIADSYEDSRLYDKLSKECPEGHVIPLIVLLSILLRFCFSRQRS